MKTKIYREWIASFPQNASHLKYTSKHLETSWNLLCRAAKSFTANCCATAILAASEVLPSIWEPSELKQHTLRPESARTCIYCLLLPIWQTCLYNYKILPDLTVQWYTFAFSLESQYLRNSTLTPPRVSTNPWLLWWQRHTTNTFSWCSVVLPAWLRQSHAVHETPDVSQPTWTEFHALREAKLRMSRQCLMTHAVVQQPPCQGFNLWGHQISSNIKLCAFSVYSMRIQFDGVAFGCFWCYQSGWFAW